MFTGCHNPIMQQSSNTAVSSKEIPYLTSVIKQQDHKSDNYWAYCFGSLVILDVARCYLWLFTLYINIKISKNSC